MESERAQSFNDRLNQWVASQGFWFQLKYSMSGRGLTGSKGYHFLQLAFRILIFLVILGVGGMIYLDKSTDTEAFSDKLEHSLVAEIKAKEGKLEGFQRQQGKLFITRFAAIGKQDAFYTDLNAKDISCRMGILDSVRKPWKTGGVNISELHINLRAGASDAVQAGRLGDMLFKDRTDVEVSVIDVEDATVTWGYSESTYGGISNSQLKIRRAGAGWWMQFRRGTFSQNWLKGLEIDEVTINCQPDGIKVEKALFRKDGGTVDLSGMTIDGAERPEVDAIAKLKNVPIDGMLPVNADQLLQGTISGQLRWSGSTNSQEGIAMAGRIELAEGDGIMLRDRIPLLRALRLVDAFNNYRRVNFQTGSFMLKTGGGTLELSEVDLKAADLMTLEGRMKVRKPTQKEKEELNVIPGKSPVLGDRNEDKPQDSSEFTLKRAAKESLKKDKDEKSDGVIEQYDARLEERQFAGETAAKMAESLRYEGEFKITVRSDAFDQAPDLKAAFPVDTVTGRIPLTVPIDGTLGTVTFVQAETIYEKGRR